MAGNAAATHFSASMATDPADSFLVSAEEMRSLLGESGFIGEVLEDTSDTHLGKFRQRRIICELPLKIDSDPIYS
jgi:hypothetical protein